MDNPTFRLEGVVRSRDELEDFEGPLTLILQLLSKNKIEIQDIRISLILDQYLAYLEEMKAMDLEVASEFVAMASHLVYIKSRMLLRSGEDEEISELEQLISSLENLKARDVYSRIHAVTEQLQEMVRRSGHTFVKPPEYLAPAAEYRYSHEKEELLAAVRRAFDRGDATGNAVPTPRPLVIPQRIVYPVTEKSREILEQLRSCSAMRLRELFLESESRTELVATFIAVLELCREGRVLFQGAEDDLIISGVSGSVLEDAEEERGNLDGDS